MSPQPQLLWEEHEPLLLPPDLHLTVVPFMVPSLHQASSLETKPILTLALG